MKVINWKSIILSEDIYLKFMWTGIWFLWNKRAIKQGLYYHRITRVGLAPTYQSISIPTKFVFSSFLAKASSSTIVLTIERLNFWRLVPSCGIDESSCGLDDYYRGMDDSSCGMEFSTKVTMFTSICL